MMGRSFTDLGHGMRLFRVLIATLALTALGWSGSAGANDLGPLEKYLDQAKPSIEMNEDGKKFQPFSFDHAAHITKDYLFDGTCSSCHHTQKDGSAAPKPCGDCHDVDGEAGETKLKAKAYHSKKSTWEGAADKGGISCLGCHKSHNKALKDGTQKGGKAPSQCAGCHKKQ
jgi:hypothetical protein